MFLEKSRRRTCGAQDRRAGGPVARVMLADSNLNITYVNAAAMALMREAAGRTGSASCRALTSTDWSAAISISSTRPPTHQRRMLAVMEKPHAGSDQQRLALGNSTCWSRRWRRRAPSSASSWKRADARHRLLNLDYTAQLVGHQPQPGRDRVRDRRHDPAGQSRLPRSHGLCRARADRPESPDVPASRERGKLAYAQIGSGFWRVISAPRASAASPRMAGRSGSRAPIARSWMKRARSRRW